MAQETRKRRVAAELQRLLNELLQTEVKDPRLRDVTVSGVELSGDLSAAKIYYATLDPQEDPGHAQAAFRKATGFLRTRVGRELRLRRTPELVFIRDISAQRGAEIARLIDSVRTRRETGPLEDGDPEPDQ